MPIFDRPNLDLAQQFMSGPQGSDRYPNMAGFARTPVGHELMVRVLRDMQARKRQPRQQPRQQQRPAALKGSR